MSSSRPPAAPWLTVSRLSLQIEQHLTPEALATKFNTSINIAKPAESKGLTAEEAAKRLIENGANVLTPPKKKGGLRKYLESLSSLFNL
jgi:sodium/potassium-transporting ATPase subunit alpha